MALKKSSRINLLATALAIFCAVLFPIPALADEGSLPGIAKEQLPVTGVYVKDEFSLPIIQQPESNFGYVASLQDTLTQFGLSSQYGNIGLLAHNYLAGGKFFTLEPGDRVYLFHSSEWIEVFVVTEVLQYQALDPYSPYSDFKDLSTGAMLTANDLFHRVYMGDRHVTFQTCIEQDGNSSWGRLFVIAEPLAASDS
jgi:hypothetical protein